MAVAALYVVLHIHLRVTQDPREPPAIETGIPYITPILGMMDNKYFLKLKYALPCYGPSNLGNRRRRRFQQADLRVACTDKH